MLLFFFIFLFIKRFNSNSIGCSFNSLAIIFNINLRLGRRYIFLLFFLYHSHLDIIMRNDGFKFSSCVFCFLQYVLCIFIIKVLREKVFLVNRTNLLLLLFLLPFINAFLIKFVLIEVLFTCLS